MTSSITIPGAPTRISVVSIEPGYAAAMQWWNDLISWLTSSDAQPTVFAAIVLFVAVLAAGLLAAWIASAAVRRVVAQRDREVKTAAIAALIDAATEASVWNSLTPQEQVLSDRAVGQADILVRLLPVKGSDVAANWAGHQLHELKRASATFGYQLDPAVVEFRDRMLEWQRHPSRTRRQFQNDLLRWRTQRQEPEQVELAAQDAWVAEQHHDRYRQTVSLSGHPDDADRADPGHAVAFVRARRAALSNSSAALRRTPRPAVAAQRHHSSNIDTGTARLCRVSRNRCSMRSATWSPTSPPSRNVSMSR